MTAAPAVHAALSRLRSALAALSFPLPVDGVAGVAGERDRLVHQLEDYVLPRYEDLDAPLLAVVGGSTGAGKSTLVNSLLLAPVAASSAIRPTTRRPLLLHHRTDEEWFTTDRILPSFPRVRIAPDAAATPAAGRSQSELEIRGTDRLPAGLALLDAPDIDSVVDENRAAAHQLLGAADLWLFVTTAARYADAVPWELLVDAQARDIVVAIVLNRVPEDVVREVEADFQERLAAAGLGGAPLHTIPEVMLEGGYIPEQYVAPLRHWLGDLAADANARSAVARRTLAGAVHAVLGAAEHVAGEADEQVRAATHLVGKVDRAEADALRRISAATADGSLLRGEVLARWQEFVGTGEWFARFQAGIGRMRDRIGSFVRGRPDSVDQVETAVEDSLVTLLAAEARQAALELDHSWRLEGGSRTLLEGAQNSLPEDPVLFERIATEVSGWQKDVLGLVREEGAGRRVKARALSTGVNALGVTLMMVIFATTGGITGAEIATAGGTAAAGQAVLVAVFGEDAVRAMARNAKESLAQRSESVIAWYLGPFREAIARLGIDAAANQEVRDAVDAVREAEPEAR
nr:ATP/GTP-binding protein [Actinomycetales bacterium]